MALPSGAGVVRLDGCLLVTDEVGDGGGRFLNEDDRFQPVNSSVKMRAAASSVVCSRPAPVSAEAVDDRGVRVAAVVGGGAYAAMLGPPTTGMRRSSAAVTPLALRFGGRGPLITQACA